MRYLKLIQIFYKNCLLVDLEYRANFLINSVMSVFWASFAILGIKILFLQRDHIGDWSYYEVLLVIGLFQLFTGVMEGVLRPNVTQIVEQIRLGTMDFLLTKPVSSQFLASMRYVRVWHLVDVAVGVGICGYALYRLQVQVSVWQALLFLLLLCSATVLLYSLWLLMVTTAFWFVRIDNITHLFSAIFDAGRFPVTIYPGWVQGVLLFVIPVGFITTVPAAAALGRLSLGYAVLSFVMAAVMFVASYFFWRFAVRHYSSASS
ncbi:MAG: hypothetical protein GXP41_11735 [Chloroflexi bacterium]|nr:hypothetical protein [Chloroflexota bacterium]